MTPTEAAVRWLDAYPHRHYHACLLSDWVDLRNVAPEAWESASPAMFKDIAQGRVAVSALESNAPRPIPVVEDGAVVGYRVVWG